MLKKAQFLNLPSSRNFLCQEEEVLEEDDLTPVAMNLSLTSEKSRQLADAYHIYYQDAQVLNSVGQKQNMKQRPKAEVERSSTRALNTQASSKISKCDSINLLGTYGQPKLRRSEERDEREIVNVNAGIINIKTVPKKSKTSKAFNIFNRKQNFV